MTPFAQEAVTSEHWPGGEERVSVLEHLLAIGTLLSGAQDLDVLLRLILEKCREITHSDAGSLFLVDRSDPDTPSLVFRIAQNDSLDGLCIEQTSIALREDSLVGHVALSGLPLNIADAYAQDHALTFNPSFDQRHGYRTVSLLVLPMLNHQKEVIGVLQLINRKQSVGIRLTPENARRLTQPYSTLEARILMCLASQAAICIERQQLQHSVEQLFEGFVRASVDIIEARDPCTAGHSERVAAMTIRLAEEINSLDDGPFRSVRFVPDQIQEIRYAALLHDFGKVGVPEAVLLKAKKLYPAQLEALRYRFTIARRELELGHVHARLALLEGHLCQAHPGLPADQAALDRAHARLDSHWDLLMRLNEPQILPADVAAGIRDQLEEMLAYRIHGSGGGDEPLLSEQELEQLMVRRGSLTHHEREAIESHASQTYRFLMQIPWTRALKQVPAIAHGHHEKLDGSGYPLGLGGIQIPLQAQMMTVADIYDALSAHDRPYKKALCPERAIAILHQEAAQMHVNAELVWLFEQRRVFEAALR